MNKILKELNLPGATTQQVIINRKLQSTSIKKNDIKIQLHLDLLTNEDSNSSRK